MATINQSPAGQTSVALSGISFNGITATATPVRTGLRLAVQGGSFATSFGGGSAITQTLIPASLRGKNTPVSSTSASGIFTLDDQISAKRADAWPS
jgi:hypothetical protein